MVFNPKDLKKDKDLSIIAKGIRLNDSIDSSFMGFLNEKFSKKYNIRISELNITLVPKEEKKQKIEKNKIRMVVEVMPNIRISHTGEEDFKNKVAVINASHYDLLDKLLSKKMSKNGSSNKD